MKKIKKILLIFFVAVFLLINISLPAFSYSVSDYNVNGDVDNRAKPVVDVKDYVRAKYLATYGSQFHNTDFLVSLRNVLIGVEILSQGNSGSGSDIYLPEVP